MFKAALLLVSLPLFTPSAVGHAQDAAAVNILAFADTSSVRIEVVVPQAVHRNQQVRATIARHGTTEALWSGTIDAAGTNADPARLVRHVSGLRPDRWSPQHPALYDLAVSFADGTTHTTRFGFRSFAARDGRLLLNGRPVFMRGNAINPPERTIPDSLHENRSFVEDYIRYQKQIGVNIIRLTRHSQIWFDVADELGMMLFQGNYGSPKWGQPTAAPDRPFEEVLAWYKTEVFEPLVNHPSVVIYILTNEQAAPEIPYLNAGADSIHRLLTRVFNELSSWDRNRAFIGNAGYGFGRAGDVCDIHRYWGWYNNSILSFYTLRDPRICWRSDSAQPITVSENTGNYTGVDGRYNLVPNSKQPDSQLNWTGHAPNSEQATRALRHQAFVAGNAIEITRRLRARNPYLAGLMPFTILFHNWSEINSFSDMKPKPVAEQFRISYQPVLLSWELWTPQVYAGSKLRPLAHVVNDAESGEDLRGLDLHYTLTASDGRIYAQAVQKLGDIAYYRAVAERIEISLPATMPTGSYTLSGRVLSGTTEVSRNHTQIFIAARDYAGGVSQVDRRVRLYDGLGATGRVLRQLGIAHDTITRVSELSTSGDLLVIGTRAWDARLADQTDQLAAFVRNGGRVLVLQQDAGRFGVGWLPAHIRLQTQPLDHPLIYPQGRPYRDGMAINPERPDHPVFRGISRDQLLMWSDFTDWSDTKPGFPQIYPVTQGFVVTNHNDIQHTAVLANYDHGLEGIALAELFDANGSVLLSGFALTDRHGIDPVADRMLVNLIRYQATQLGHHAQPLIADKITWGDYASERGVLTGIYSGLILNTVPIVPRSLQKGNEVRVDENGYQYAGRSSGWNTRPAIQYVGRGRRPFGPYHFSLAGSARLPAPRTDEGSGQFWVRVPGDRTRMITTVWNPASIPLELTVRVQSGATTRATIPAGATERIESSINGTNVVGVAYRGDRRLVILETEFR